MEVGLSNLFLIGTSYKQLEIKERSLVSCFVKDFFYEYKYDFKTIKNIVVLNTCNRTELIFISNCIKESCDELLEIDSGFGVLLKNKNYTLNGKDVLEHLTKVSCGYESQVLGDFQVLSQVKKSFQEARLRDENFGFMSRLQDTIIRACKDIKTNTEFNDGTSSFSYSTLQYLEKKLQGLNNKKVLLVGLGKTGQSTCKHIVKTYPLVNLTIINRSYDKIKFFEKNHSGIKAKKWEKLRHECKKSDIIITATNSNETFINKSFFDKTKKYNIIDLSIPINVNHDVKDLNNVELIDINELSKYTTKTLEKRKGEIPKVLKIIECYTDEFIEWSENRYVAKTLNKVKNKLYSIHNSVISSNNIEIDENYQNLIDGVVKKITGQIATNINKSCNKKIQAENLKKIFDIG